ncbi:MAG: TolC family protein [Bacteroidetes bacterium]|nr:TolC family protein [Bacteroidota bacterium]
MKTSVVKEVLIIILIFFGIQMQYGQNIGKKLFTADSIPPMQVFIDSAMINSPAIKMYETQIVQNQCQIELLKYAWMKEIYMVADSKYGRYGTGQPVDQMSLGYGAGALIKVPISAIVGNTQRKKIAKMELNESIYNKEVLISELKKVIIKQYNETIYKKQILAIRVEALEVASISQKLSEKEFKGGLVHVDQYSRVSEIYYNQLQLLEQCKMELKTSLSILLEMCGIKN